MAEYSGNQHASPCWLDGHQQSHHQMMPQVSKPRAMQDLSIRDTSCIQRSCHTWMILWGWLLWLHLVKTSAPGKDSIVNNQFWAILETTYYLSMACTFTLGNLSSMIYQKRGVRWRESHLVLALRGKKWILIVGTSWLMLDILLILRSKGPPIEFWSGGELDITDT